MTEAEQQAFSIYELICTTSANRPIAGSRSHAAEIQAIEQAMDVLEILKRRARQPKAS
jgi:hypothetical protein